MELINMTSQHVAQVAALEKVCFSDPWSEKSVASELRINWPCGWLRKKKDVWQALSPMEMSAEQWKQRKINSSHRQ